jgi:molybdopterin-synthase adenylyltransferase
MSDPRADTRRHSRQIVLPEFGVEGQARLGRARVLIVGLGGLGSPAALYLTAAGVGELVLNDFDQVDETNLQRQILYGEADIGRAKTEAAAETLARMDRRVRCVLVPERLQGETLIAAVRDCDVVIDGSDNFGTRFAVNAACVATRTPLVSGAALRYEGQLAVFRPDLPDGPCYRCLYGESDEALEDCRNNGVLAPLVGVIGSLMAVEAIKILVGLGADSAGRVLLFDARTLRWREVALARDPQCPVCEPVARAARSKHDDASPWDGLA